MPVPHFHALDLLDFFRRQRPRLGARLQHLHLRPGIFLEVHGIDEQGSHRFGHEHQAMRAHQRCVMPAKRPGQRLALLGPIDVARIRVCRDAALPARSPRAHRHELHLLHHREGDGKFHVAVEHGLHIGTRLQDFEMNRQLARRLAVALDHLAVVVHDQHGIRCDLGARRRADLDDEGIMSGNAS
jgi:hypothetical protein